MQLYLRCVAILHPIVEGEISPTEQVPVGVCHVQIYRVELFHQTVLLYVILAHDLAVGIYERVGIMEDPSCCSDNMMVQSCLQFSQAGQDFVDSQTALHG